MALAADTGAQGVVDAAKGYLEKDYAIGSYFGGGNNNWCGLFLYRCAKDAGENMALGGSENTMIGTESAMKWFVQNGCEGGYFYKGVNYGNYGMTEGHLRNKDNYSPALGDIIFYDWDGNPSNFGHMELLAEISGRTITTIGGSTGESCSKKNSKGEYWNKKHHVHAHTYDISNKFIVGYVRPNYGKGFDGTAVPLTITPTSEPGEHREAGAAFYFRGSITSGSPITYVTEQIREADNNSIIYEKVINPNKTNVDILNDGLDSFKFGSLTEGNYYLWLFAGDSSGEEANWCVHFSVGYPAEDVPTPPATGPNTTTTTTKTQYRYHRYIDEAGNVSLCPYYGSSIFHSTLSLQYTDWMDTPLTKNSNPGGHNHVNQGAACTNSGCIDPSRSTERFTDGNSNWYYEETQTVTVEVPGAAVPTPPPAPAVTPPPALVVTPEPVSTPTPTPTPTSTLRPTPTPKPTPTPAPVPTKNPCENGHEYRVDSETDTAVYYVCDRCGDYYSEKKAAKPQLPLPTVKVYSNEFSDIKAHDWFYNNVVAAYELGLMKGTAGGTFSPNNNVTIAEAVTLAARIHSIYQNGSDEFLSYDGGKWFDPYVDYAKDNGILTMAYNYDRPATREDFVHILAKALPEEALKNIAGSADFADVDELKYASDVQLLSGAGVINGIQEDGQTYFKPLATITRAEVAAVVSRMAKPGSRIGK